MSLLSICQQVARVIPVSAPTVIVGNTEQTASLLLACAQEEGRALARRANWTPLVTEHTFSTASATADYSLPSDFDRLVDFTVWDRSNYERTRGPLSPQDWQTRKSSVLASSATTWKRFRIRNVSGTVKFSLEPTPDAIESMVFEYVSKNWCESSGGTGQSAWAADTDVGVLDEYLMELGIKWRMLNRLGMAYEEAYNEYQNEVAQAVARDGASPMLSMRNDTTLKLISANNIPDTGYGA